ncbi:TPA: DUF2591 family protein [Escherichia coli]|uniref:DUF2591 family protein n=1 Tax=Enterobacter TaxID=547 RepID=UPI0011EA9A27|nr:MULTISPECIES: DUF2591 family protein [Enterobacter]HDI5944769.1 DUF2591 family protein [Escherichia coli]ELZ5053236.1 DUF2591 family protein [Enterobacter hormaechei]ELZ5063195.1 DUF2591 family protein [Enterobacter hormaechei]KAA8638894.1 hypothetical protein FZN37_002358 [Enterobacter hormaechei]MBF9846422.1 DUF2591 family protein [Enterobacter hormaechei]
MDYSKLSDGEISIRLAYFLKPKYSATIHPNDKSGAQLSWNWFNTVQNTGYFPLRRAEELFSVMKKHRIGLAPSGKTVWQATHESGIKATHRNPLRAIAIVFLMMQESANVPANSTGSDIR